MPALPGFPRGKSQNQMNLLQFDSEPSWVAGVTTYWRDRLHVNPASRHCLASGHTPIPIYREMVCAAQRGLVSFQQTTVFALDEFGELAPDDAGKCSNMLRRDLVGPVGLPETNFHELHADVPDLDEQCRAYDRAIGHGFDIVLLGIGVNGHLGMNEPGSAIDSPTRRTDLHPSTIAASARYLTHQRLPRWGLTVGMKQFFASKEVWLVAIGSAKAKIIQSIVQGEISEQVPASLMRQHPNCTLFIDAAAGALL